MNQAKSFKDYLDKTGEIGTVAQVFHPVLYVAGLPTANPGEVVIFESGEQGQVISLSPDYAEVIIFSQDQPDIGTKVARTSSQVSLDIGSHLLGHVMDPLGNSTPINPDADLTSEEKQVISTQLDRSSPSIDERKSIDLPFDTGVSLVDTIVPIAQGQRELILGDRKVGKTSFLKQAFVSHAMRGGIGIWAAIAKRATEILELKDFVTIYGIAPQSIIVATTAGESSGLIFQTPYAAMSIAEYFRDQGRDVLLVLDDLTQHARKYREVTLLAKRFPGRSAYPGDIFYTHARLMERAGQYKTGSITCLPVAETVLGDISGYIQTNLMSMTDGHIFFDSELFNQGRRPAINPFLSVTRVGHQVQSSLHKSISRKLASFLVEHEKLTKLLHFGGELGEAAKQNLHRGDLLLAHFDQSSDYVIPMPINLMIIGSIWAELWSSVSVEDFKKRSEELISAYLHRDDVKNYVDAVVSGAADLDALVQTIQEAPQFVTGSDASVDNTTMTESAKEQALDEASDALNNPDESSDDTKVDTTKADDSKSVNIALNQIEKQQEAS